MADPNDRIRSSVSETAGEILMGVKTTDVSASEAFLLRELPLGQRVPWADALNPAVREYWFYPSAKLGEEGIDAYRYETKLARLNRTYPPSVLVCAGQVIAGRADLTAREAIEYILSQWQLEHPWLSWKPIPELLIRDPVGVNHQALRIAAISFAQDPENRRSMRSVIDEWLAIFEGHALRVDADDDLVIVAPPWSPAAAPGLAANLTRDDLYDLPSPEHDAAHIINRATVRSQGYGFVADQAVMQPAYLRRFWAAMLPAQPAPTDRLLITGTIWPAATGVLVGGNELQVTLAWDLWSTPSETGTPVDPEGSGTEVVTLRPNVPIERVYGIQVCGLGMPVATLTTRLTWTGLDVEVRGWVSHLFVDNQLPWPFHCRRWMGWEVRLNGVGERWMRSAATISATWDEPAALPGNEESIAQFGVRERTVTSNIFMLTPEQALDVAQGIVTLLQHPSRRYRGLEQSAWNAYPVRPGMINRQAGLPNGEIGVVEGWQYNDSFDYHSALIRSSFDLVIPGALAGPPLADHFVMDNGTFGLFDDGTLMLVG